MMPKQLCGAKTPNGPCTLEKGHLTEWHRHRIYECVAWKIKSAVTGELLEEGNARVPLNYALTRQLNNFDNLVIEITKTERRLVRQ